MCARRRTYFLLRRQKKVGKEKATPLAVSLRFAAGSLRCSGMGRRCGTRCAPQRALRSNSRSESEHEAWSRLAQPMPAPRPALLGTARGEWGEDGPSLRLAPTSEKAARLVLAPPEGRGAGHASERRARACTGLWRCPPSRSKRGEGAEGDSGGCSRSQRRARACTEHWRCPPSGTRAGKAPKATRGSQFRYGLPGCRSYRLGTPSRSRSPRGRLGWRS